MLITYEREKLINAIIFFANHTKPLVKIKLFKLLYLLDFEHFRQTGMWVTNAISAQDEQITEYIREYSVSNAEFDDSHFSKRELRIMDELVDKHGVNSKADSVI